MTNKILAIQGNHPKGLNPTSDTSVFLANEAQKKNYKIFYYEPKNLSIINNNVVAKGFFVKFDYTSKNFFKILKYQKLNLLRCKFILIRQDPPFNLEYISTTYILDKIKNKVKIVNNPTSIRNISEKLYSSYYQKFMPKTIFTKDLKEIKNFYKICGAISRVPKKGSFLSNLSKGAKPTLTKLSKIENKISNILAKDLKNENVYFAGIDFIDQKLNGDINVTSPTGLKTYYDLSKINLAKKFWKGLKA